MKHNDVIEVLANRKAPHITLNQVMEKTGHTAKYCKRIVKIVMDARLACLKPPYQKDNPRYTLGPRKVIRKLIKTNRPKKVTQRDKVWKAIRVFRPIFNRQNLIELTDTKATTVDDFIKLLAHHKFIRKVGASKEGNAWQLIKDSGTERPLLPEIKTKEA